MIMGANREEDPKLTKARNQESLVANFMTSMIKQHLHEKRKAFFVAFSKYNHKNSNKN